MPLVGCITAAADSQACQERFGCEKNTGSNADQIPADQRAQSNPSTQLATLLHNTERLRPFLARAQAHRIQVIYTRVQRQPAGPPRLTTAQFRVDADYYYPASLIKLPVALLTLEKLNELGLRKENSFKITPVNRCTEYKAGGCRSFQDCIEQLFVFSNNDAYNRLYEFFGRDEINRRLQAKGYRGSVHQRFKSGCTGADGRSTGIFRVDQGGGTPGYQQESRTSTTRINAPRPDMRVGNKTLTRRGLIDEPMDFSEKSYLPLLDLHRMLIAVIFPDAAPPAQRFAISPRDHAFLLRAMSMRPRDLGGDQADSFRKYLLLGSDRRMPKHLRIYNKVGLSYGFMTDVSYITDAATGVEFFLSASIYVNHNGIMNDGQYDYETIGYPFMKALGQTIVEDEIRRRRKNNVN